MERINIKEEAEKIISERQQGLLFLNTEIKVLEIMLKYCIGMKENQMKKINDIINNNINKKEKINISYTRKEFYSNHSYRIEFNIYNKGVHSQTIHLDNYDNLINKEEIEEILKKKKEYLYKVPTLERLISDLNKVKKETEFFYNKFEKYLTNRTKTHINKEEYFNKFMTELKICGYKLKVS